MKIFINAYTLRVAGGLSVGLNFFNYLCENNQEDEIIALVPPNCGYEKYQKENIKIISIEAKYLKPYYKIYVNKFYLPNFVNNINPDVIFSMGNVAIKTSIPQLLLFHLPHACYDEKPYWGKLDWFSLLYNKVLLNTVKKYIGFSTKIVCQTQTMKTRLANRFNISTEKIGIVPNAVSLNSNQTSGKLFFDEENNHKYFLTLSKYYPHKNIEILIPLAKKVKQLELNYKFIVTLDKSQGIGAGEILEGIEKLKLEDVIINIGVVSHSDVPTLYSQVDALFFPTLLESFSGTYVESMHFKKPIFTSKLDFAEEVCKEAAYFFDPFSVDSIISSLSNINNIETTKEKIKIGSSIVDGYPGWNKVGEMYVENLKSLVK